MLLSPHEFTTLMMIWDAPDQIEPDREELRALLEHQLISVDLLAAGNRRIQLTPRGRAVLQVVSRIR